MWPEGHVSLVLLFAAPLPHFSDPEMWDLWENVEDTGEIVRVMDPVALFLLLQVPPCHAVTESPYFVSFLRKPQPVPIFHLLWQFHSTPD